MALLGAINKIVKCWRQVRLVRITTFALKENDGTCVLDVNGDTGNAKAGGERQH